MYYVIAVLIFGILIATHELGHFLTAKLFNVRVSEFAIGMGPALLKKQKGETLYALRAFPIGGFCAMEEDEESDDPRHFTNQIWWKRFIILAAGAVMNFITGVIVLLCIVPNSSMFATPTITGFFEGCPYNNAQGLQTNDTFYSIDGRRVFLSSDVSMLLSRGTEYTYDIVLIRDGEKVELKDYKLSPVEYTINGKTDSKIGLRMEKKDKGVIADLKYTWNGARDFVRLVWMSLSDLVSGKAKFKDLSGPLGIVVLFNDVGENSPDTTTAAYNFAYLTAFIAVNLAVMNLLPIPALDGGRLFFLVINALILSVFRRKLDPKYEGYVHAAGLVLLLGLMAVVFVSDVYKQFIQLAVSNKRVCPI